MQVHIILSSKATLIPSSIGSIASALPPLGCLYGSCARFLKSASIVGTASGIPHLSRTIVAARLIRHVWNASSSLTPLTFTCPLHPFQVQRSRVPPELGESIPTRQSR